MLLARSVRRSARRSVVALALAALAAACPAEPGDASTTVRGPTLPLTADLSGQDAEVAVRVVRAREALLAADDAEAWGRLGLTYEANHLPELAAPCYAEAADRAPGDARWPHRLGVVRQQLGDVDGALDAYGKALARDRTLAPAHWSRGFLQLARGDLDEARTSFRKATRLAPGLPVGRVGSARVALQEDDPDAAIQLLRRVLDEHPGEAYAKNLLASAYRQAGRWDEVADELADVAPGEPHWPDPADRDLAELRAPTPIAREDRAVQLATEGGNVERSVELLEGLVAARPDDAALRSMLANAYVREGRLQRARAAYEAALETTPDHTDSVVGLAALLVALGEPAAALERIERAIETQPRFGRAHAIRGHALRALGRYEAALAAYETALELDARQPDLRVDAGMLALELRRWDEAERHFVTALDQGAASPDLFLGRARALLQLGRPAEARASLEGVVSWPDALRPALERLEADLAAQGEADDPPAPGGPS